MDSTGTGWWHRHGWTVAILVAAFAAAFAIRTIWTYPIVAQYGPLYSYAGGSDSYYHSRVMSYIILNHTNLVHDPLLRYPVGATNPREPLFDWMNALLGITFAGAFGGNPVTAGAWFLDLQSPLWAALSVFPIYLIGKEVSNRRMGLIAALIYPFLSASIDSSIFGYANYLSFYTFLILVSVYAYLRTVKAVGSRRWIPSFRHGSQYAPGFRNFLRTERSAVKWAVFTGVALGATALAWQGYTYVVVVVGLSLVISMVAERIRHIDSTGLYFAAWIVGLVGFPMEFPYYFVQYGSSFTASGFQTFFVLPALLFFGVLVLLLPFVLLRDVPWVFSIPLMAGLILAGAGGLAVVNPSLFTSIITGQGYFVKSLVYSTVAEAQAPSIDQLVIGYGIVTFFLALVGVGLFVYLLIRGRFKRVHVVFLVFGLLSIYLPISAAKFFLLGSPAFALLSAEAVRRALDLGSYPELRRTVASLSDRKSQFAAFRRAFKPRHVLVLLLVLVILLPNVWVSIDAGIPGNTKSGFAAQIGATLPPWLQLNTSNPSSYYLGAAGSDIDTSNLYDSAGYNWLATQDANVPVPDRPAVVSWWDYGFQTIDQGQHPSVADNFQNGIDPAGQFLLAQNQSIAIGVLATTLLNGEQLSSGQPYLPASLNTILAADGLNLATLHSYLVNESADYTMVVNNPTRYLPVDPGTLTDENAMFMAVSYYIAGALPTSGVVKLYDDIMSYTGESIRYALTDSRLIPFSGTDTGIYYAPADLTGRVLDNAGNPESYFNVSILGSDGNTYPEGELPADVSAVSYNINYFAPFYNSMIYRIYFGYNGTQAGLSPGIPGLSLNASIEPGWMLSHFEVVYQTAYYCPPGTASGSASCVATNTPTAIAEAKANKGTADTSATSYFSGGESFLAYYPGQTLVGDVQLPDGTPVGGVHVTVDDGQNIPHMSVVTASDGSYSIVLPPGNDTLNVTTGTFSQLTQQGNIVLKSLKISVPPAVGYSFNAPTVSQTVTIPASVLQGRVYWATNASSTAPTNLSISGAKIVLWGAPNGSRTAVTSDASGAFGLNDMPAGIYNVSILYAGHNYSEPQVTLSPTTPANETVGLQSATISGFVTSAGAPVVNAAISVSGAGGSASNTTNATGAYVLNGFGPGNYSVVASLPGTDLRSLGAFVAVTAPGQKNSVNLTLQASTTVSVQLTVAGAPAAGVPVRFLPLPNFTNASIAPIAAIDGAVGNGTVVTSSATGRTVAVLPAGTYDVYVVGYVGSTLYAGTARVTASLAGAAATVPIALAPAAALQGTVASTGTETSTAVYAYGSNGGAAFGWASGTGAYTLYVAPGPYSVLAIEGTGTPGSTTYAALASVTVASATALALAPTVAEAARFTVGSPTASGTVFGAAGALVNVSYGTGGATVPFVAAANGSVAAIVPSSLPLSAGSYCVRAQAVGFTTTSVCGLSPVGLAGLGTLTMPLVSVPVAIRVTGGPSGAAVQVNLTAASPSAVSRSVSGGPNFALTVAPGTYHVSAYGLTSNASIRYRPAANVTVTIPLGSPTVTLPVALFAQRNVTGTLTLPSGATLAATTVSLSSPTFNVSVNGTAFEDGFYVPAGGYTAYANVTVRGANWSALVPITVPSTGPIAGPIALTSVAYPLSGALVGATDARLALNSTLTLTGTGGTTVVVRATAGAFSVDLPSGTSYSVTGAARSTVVGPNGTYAATWASATGATCRVGAGASNCTVRFVPTTTPVWLNGTLVAPGVPGTLAGTLRLVGPYPYTNLTLVNTSGGSFAASVNPGSYQIYASASGSNDLLANFTAALVLPGSDAPVTVALAPTWLDTISPLSPTSSGSAPGYATITVRNPLGIATIFPTVAPGTSIQVALPVGNYTVSALATGSPYGVVTNATASQTVPIRAGNLATNLALAYAFVPAVAGAITGQTSASTTGGANVTFAFSVRNTGDEPVTVHPVGSPASWTFAFSIGNLTLPVGGAPVSGSVTIVVPAGTAVQHPAVGISFALANGTVVGRVAPGPTIDVLGYYGIAVYGTDGSVAAEVGIHEVKVPFYLVNTGNDGTTVLVSVVDLYRIQSLGWSVGFVTGGQNVTQPTKYVAAGSNATWFVDLTSTSSIFVPPGGITVAATALNASGAAQGSATLHVPAASVTVGPTNGTAPIVITGPSIGPAPSVLPDWVVPVLVFVPTLALIVGVLVYRYNRSRRWRRR
ncbi:MAG TPA: carboxypeptidase regulatory-like domain-containing protein [Thermoplasmata archaeon]|nr:carboxypeptidase regulatory-like domain-containing protein [Thermoplasmata archaeon]